MAPKVKKEVVPAKTEAKSRSLKVKKAVLKGVHSYKRKKIRISLIYRGPKALWLWRMNKLDHYAIIKFPHTTESAMKKIEDNNMLIKQVVKKLYDIDVAEVNIGR
uniref:Large ribosomal subunit protein uL23 N-terminal domain-containing protein n=1 Tax=Salvator merianae TaxID=96440 RepID=A0A8D0E6T0_SALMN